MPKYWIRFHVGECPLCGRDRGWKERVVGEKPSDWNERYVAMSYEECYDWCDR